MDINQILAEADKAEKSADLKTAASLYESALEQDTQNQTIKERLGWCLSRDQDYNRAADLFEQIAQSQPHVAKWRYMVGYQFYQQERWHDAIAWFDKSLALNPDYVVVLYRKGYSHFKLGQIGDALQAFDLCRTTWHNLPEGPAKEKDKTNCAKAAYHQAEILIENPRKIEGGAEGSVQLLIEAVGLDPDNHNNHYLLGKALLELNRPTEAIASLERANEIHPNVDYILDRLAQAFSQLDRLAEAEGIYERIPERSRKDYILRNLGQLQMRRGQYQSAIKTLTHSIQKNRKNHFAHYYLGLCYRETGQFAAAVREIKESINLRKRNFDASFNEAQEALDDILSNHPEAKENQSVILSQTGKIVKYFDDKGYGFIQDHTGASIFFHISDCYQKTVLPIGTDVQYDIGFGDKGKKAIHVQSIKRS